ncbi:hypothetical protein [Allobaculum sp. Allo2]|nr:hypothetical protein [Allobaculum sp. Allo2]
MHPESYPLAARILEKRICL